MTSSWATLRASAYLLRLLVAREFKGNYRRTLAGMGWAFLKPLATLLIFVVVFQHLMRVQAPTIPYAAFVLIALVPWQAISDALSRGAISITGNATIVAQSEIHRFVFPLAATFHSLITTLISFVLLVFVLLYFGITPSVLWLWCIPLLMLQIIAVSGLSLGLSVLVVYMRDIPLVLPLVLQVLMFASPIAYPVTMVPQAYRSLYMANPIAQLVEAYRDVLARGIGVSAETMWILSLWSVLFLFVGVVLYRTFDRQVPDII